MNEFKNVLCKECFRLYRIPVPEGVTEKLPCPRCLKNSCTVAETREEYMEKAIDALTERMRAADKELENINPRDVRGVRANERLRNSYLRAARAMQNLERFYEPGVTPSVSFADSSLGEGAKAAKGE